MEAGEQSALANQEASVKTERYTNDEFGDYKSLESIDRYDQCAFNTTVNCVLLQSSYVDPGNVCSTKITFTILLQIIGTVDKNIKEYKIIIQLN